MFLIKEDSLIEDKGIVIKKIADFFYIKTKNRIYEAKPRGNFKKENKTIIVGDYVDILVLDDENKKAIIEKVYDRSNMLIRPSIANITKIILVFSVKNPKINISLIDRFLIMAENKHIEAILCFSKIDLDEKKDYKKISDIYKKIGYEIIEYSAIYNIGKEDLLSKINGDIIVIAGPSGVGKSSLINTLSDDFCQATSNISLKLQKGKNTTTYTTLLDFADNSYIADTPGFSSLKLDDITKDELKYYFVEFEKYSLKCKFGNKCLHDLEPSCCVREAFENNLIEKSRYKSYISILNEIKQNQKRRKY